ncbi:hypothetical protein [Streptomyces sp. NPDC056160]|uniref:hypothetical protein n=1 Tax=Streptomyces sp. NPDC056160 TaxID=3345731 RepID=UPI0035DFF89F
MSAAAHAADQAAPHPQPQPAAAGARPRGGDTAIRVPLRLVVGAQYPDAALSTYVKVAALALRPEGCTARVATLATYLGMSKSSVERGLRPLRHPDPVDGLVELPTTRRTKRGGTGDSAHRVTRPLAPGEKWVLIPVRAAEALPPRLLRVYAVLAYATALQIPVTAAELGEMLHHHTGKHAGQHLGERQARRLIDQLDATGWLTVRRREGEQGRHAYETRRRPLHSVPAPAAAAAPAPSAAVLEDQVPGQLPLWEGETPVINDGSGADDHDGSLASKEDHLTDRREKTQVVGGSRRRRSDRKWVAAPVDNSTLPDTFRPGASRAARGNRPDSSPSHQPSTANLGGYAGPELRWTERIHTALAPVRHELADIRRYVLRRIAREIGHQLDTGISPERMAARIADRYRRTMRADIRDFGAWLLAVGIPHRGCEMPDCEEGTQWPTGQPCRTCASRRESERAWWREARALEVRLQQLRAERTARTAAAADAPPSGVRPLPPKATYRQRTAASDDQIRADIAEHGPETALHIWGHLRTLPLLHDHQHPETGTDRRTHAQ